MLGAPKITPRLITHAVDNAFLPLRVMLMASCCFWQTWANVYAPEGRQ